jgi:translocation and assembly module TamA
LQVRDGGPTTPHLPFALPASPPTPGTTTPIRPLRRALCAFALAGSLLAPAPPLAADDPGAEPQPLQPAERPLARFALSEGADRALEPLLARVVEAAVRADPFDPEDDERVLRRLRDTALEVLATEGYFAATIGVAPDQAEGRSRYLLTVNPGARTTVVAVEIRLTGAIEARPDRIEALRAAWELPAGQAFRDPAWRTARSRLLAKVHERDYPAARLIEAEAEIDAEAAQARLRIAIDSGPAFTFGELLIVEEEGKGLRRYDRTLVERFNDIRRGDPYDAARLLELQRRLQAGPYFASVLVDMPIDAQQPHEVPIRLLLVEARSKRVHAGIGFSTNTGALVEALYRQVGLFGRPYMLQTGAAHDRVRTLGYADIVLPPKPDGARDSMGVLVERSDIQNEIVERVAAGVERLYQRDEPGQANGRSFESRTSLRFQRETTAQRGDPASRFTNDTLTLANAWTWRRLDSLTHPTRGDVISIVGAAGVSRSGLRDLLAEGFFYGYGRYVRYFPLGRHQLIARGEVGHVVSDDLRFVPSHYRFRTGGAGSVRGYPYRSLGVQEGAAITGADSLVVGSLEYVHWLTGAWGAAAFYDVGDADNELERVRWAQGYGVGLRLRTIAGPLALDIAHGERDRRWRVHFSVAIAF